MITTWRLLAMSLVAALGLALAPSAASAAALETVRVGLNFLPNGIHVGLFAARELGWYREAGLEVEIQKGEGSSDAVRRMGSGVVDFAMADLGSLILGRSRGLKVKAVGVILDKDPSVIVTLKSAGIRTPKDLEGKSVGAQAASAQRSTWPALAALNSVDPQKVTWVDMPAAAYAASLITKKVHAIASYVTSFPGYETQAKKAGEELAALFYADFGVDIYGAGLLTSEQLIKDKPDLVRRFVQTSMRGFAWSFENPDESIRLFMKSLPEASPDRIRSEARIMADLMLTHFAAKEGIGHYDEKKVAQTRDLTLKGRGTDPASIPAKDISTNEFLPRLFPKRGNF
jgi:NitT/TauT family transport system substrate-binding protein